MAQQLKTLAVLPKDPTSGDLTTAFKSSSRESHPSVGSLGHLCTRGKACTHTHTHIHKSKKLIKSIAGFSVLAEGNSHCRDFITKYFRCFMFVMCILLHLFAHTCGGQRTTFMSHFSLLSPRGSRDLTQVVSVGSKHLYPQSQHTRPMFNFRTFHHPSPKTPYASQAPPASSSPNSG